MRKSAWRRIVRGEVVLLNLAVFFLALLLITQAFLFKDSIRPYLSIVDRYEGEQISFEIPLYAAAPLKISDTGEVSSRLQSLRHSKVVIIRMIQPANHSNIFVTVNGKVVDDFRKGEVKLTVYDGDYVEIDAVSHQEAAQFIINVPNSSLISPIDGLVLEGAGSLIPVGKIKFKQ